MSPFARMLPPFSPEYPVPPDIPYDDWARRPVLASAMP